MRKNLFVSALLLLLGIFAVGVSAQTNTDVGIRENLAGGEVAAVEAGKITLNTKDGRIEAVISDKTTFKKIPPDNPTLKAAVDATFAEIGVGDKLLVTGVVSADKKTIPAKGVYLITKADISQKLTKEQEDWRARGLSGRVVGVNPQTNAVTVAVRGMMGERTISVLPKEKTEYFRYAPDSIEFSKAKKSSIAEIEAGDEIRVLGDRNADGSEVQADKIVTGGFKTIGGTIKTINVEKGEVVISDFQTKKDVTINVGSSSILKQFPPEMAQRLAQFQAMQAGGQGGFRPPTPGQTPNPQTTPQPQGQNPNPMGGGGQGGGMRGGIDDSRFPAIKLTDLKVGEMIGVLSTKNKEVSRINAIKLFSGVEPFVKMAQAQAAAGGGGQRGGGANSGFTIPGLDGFGTP